MDALPQIVWHLDDPVADPALVPLYFVAKKAAEHVTVVLSGEGADEFFGGYTIYREPLSLARGRPGCPTPCSAACGAVSPAHARRACRGKSFLERGTTPIEERYYGNARIFTEEEKRRLLRRYDPTVRYTDVTAPLYAEAAGARRRDHDAVRRPVYTWLRGDILVKADRMSMAHSLELRVPFLDREVFEVAADASRSSSSCRRGRRRPSSRCAGRWTASCRRPSSEPARSSASRRRPGSGSRTRCTTGPGTSSRPAAPRTCSTAAAVLRMLDEHRAGPHDYTRKVWTVLVFCIWHAIFVERRITPEIPATVYPVAL